MKHRVEHVDEIVAYEVEADSVKEAVHKFFDRIVFKDSPGPRIVSCTEKK